MIMPLRETELNDGISVWIAQPWSNDIGSGWTDLTLVAGAVAAKGKPGLKQLGRNYVIKIDSYTIS